MNLKELADWDLARIMLETLVYVTEEKPEFQLSGNSGWFDLEGLSYATT